MQWKLIPFEGLTNLFEITTLLVENLMNLLLQSILARKSLMQRMDHISNNSGRKFGWFSLANHAITEGCLKSATASKKSM